MIRFVIFSTIIYSDIFSLIISLRFPPLPSGCKNILTNGARASTRITRQQLTGDTMFGALRGQHGAFPLSSLQKGDAGAYVKKSSLSLTVLSLCAEAQGLLLQTRLWPNR